MEKIDLLKSHIEAYTRKDGAVVQAHDDKRQAKSGTSIPAGHDFAGSLGNMGHGESHKFSNAKFKGEKFSVKRDGDQYVMQGGEGTFSQGGKAYSKEEMAAKLGKWHANDGLLFHGGDGESSKRRSADSGDPHPNIVGRAEKLQGGDAKEAHGFHFAGKEFSSSGKEGTSNHDGRPVRHFKEVTKDGKDSGDHAWLDHKGNVHADSKSDVPRMKAMADAGEKKKPSNKSPDGAKKASPAPATAKPVRSGNEGHGFHGEAMSDHIRKTHGDDTYHGSLSEKDSNAANEAGHKKFAEAAGHLVSGKHFDSHEEARDYLDSTHGRHLHDGASSHGGDIRKVPWLQKDVATYRAAKAKQKD